jgi:glycosyltransferase involved in cell wall biosynthesis
VRFLGVIPYRSILHYYQGAVALAFPSLLETFGHPMLEAMLAGTPIVAADIPALREIAGDIALYFPPDDPIELAHAVDEVRAEPDAAKARVARGRARAAAFSWRTSVDRLCNVFDEVLGENRGGGG